MSEKKKQELTAKQLAFCQNMAKGMQVSFAALNAGYGSGDLKKAEYAGNKLKKNPRVIEKLAELQGSNENSQRTSKDVVNDIAFGIEQAKKYADLNSLHKFLSLEAKILGLEKENLNVTGNVDFSIANFLTLQKARTGQKAKTEIEEKPESEK